MTTILQIHRVKEIPTIWIPSSIYLVKPDNSENVQIYVTDETGQASFRALGDAVTEEQILTAIEILINQPNGIAGLTQLGFLDPSIRLDGQSTIIQGDNEEYLWRDNQSTFIIRAFTGGNNPTYDAVIGNIQGLLFSPRTMNQVMCDYHVDHDIALGTKHYPHIHWMPLTNATGMVRWGIEYSVAKGHGQQAFHPAVTVYVNHVVSQPSAGVHMVSEVSEQDAIPATNIEPDSFIKIRLFRDATNDTFPDAVHAWNMDLHYQFARLGTKNKAPNFYG